MECSVDDCDRTAVARGWCFPHYQRWRRTGSVNADVMVLSQATLEERLTRRLLRVGSCLIWTGSKTPQGYGRISVSRDVGWQYTHIVAHTLWIGPVPPSYEVDHHCFRPACCDPRCLEAVPAAVNMARAIEHRRLTRVALAHALAGADAWV